MFVNALVHTYVYLQLFMSDSSSMSSKSLKYIAGVNKQSTTLIYLVMQQSMVIASQQ